MKTCAAIGCTELVYPFSDCCPQHARPIEGSGESPATEGLTLSQRYPQYYKPVGELTELDVYAVHALFGVQDPSGCIQHASKKLLLPGVRTGAKPRRKEIQEARDTLDRWLVLNALGLVD